MHQKTFPFANPIKQQAKMEVLFKLLKDKADGNGFAPIYLISYFKGEELKMSMSLKCSLEIEKKKVNQVSIPSLKFWDEKKMRFTKSQEGYFELNTILDGYEQKIKKFLIEFRVNNERYPSVKEIKAHIQPKKEIKKKEKSFWTIADEWLKHSREKEKKAKNTLENYITMLNHWKDFERNTGIKIQVNGYTNEVHDKFLEFMCNYFDYQPNTIWTWIKCMRTFFKYCVKKDYKLHEKHSTLEWTYMETEKIHLLPAELKKIAAVQLEDKYDKARDSFLFACVTSPRYGDLKNFRKEHIITKPDGTKAIKFFPKKSNSLTLKRRKSVEVPLNNVALSILEKYNWGEHGNLLPMVTNQTMNEYVKEICKKAGINDLVEKIVYKDGKPLLKMVKKYTIVSMHTARHTFGVVSAMNSMPLLTIKAIMGHSKLSTTENYLKIAGMHHHTTALNIWNEVDLKIK